MADPAVTVACARGEHGWCMGTAYARDRRAKHGRGSALGPCACECHGKRDA